MELEVGSWEGSPSPNGSLPGLGYDELSAVATQSALLLGLLLEKDGLEEKVPLSSYGGVAQLVERLTGSQEVRGFESHRLHRSRRSGGCEAPVTSDDEAACQPFVNAASESANGEAQWKGWEI